MVAVGKIWKTAQAVLRLPDAERQHKSVIYLILYNYLLTYSLKSVGSQICCSIYTELDNHDVKNHLLQIDKREYLILSWYRCIINDWWV